MRSLFDRVVKSLFISKSNRGITLLYLLIGILSINMLGNIPMIRTLTLYYRVTLGTSIIMVGVIWLISIHSSHNKFLAHFMPISTPNFLIGFLPLIEAISVALRPLVLSVRLSTNLAAGHIILYIFSFFSLSIGVMGMPLLIVIVAILALEVGIRVLQSFIYSTLVNLYEGELGDLLN